MTADFNRHNKYDPTVTMLQRGRARGNAVKTVSLKRRWTLSVLIHITYQSN